MVVDPNNTGNSSFIGLASSSANATAASPILIKLTNVTGTGNYLSEVDVETQRAAWSQSQLAELARPEHRRAGAVPVDRPGDSRPQLRGEERCHRGIAEHRHGFGPGRDHRCRFRAALPQNEALDLAAAQPADITFYNAGMVVTTPADGAAFQPVELVVTLQKGIALENTGVVDATAGAEHQSRFGPGRGEQGPALADQDRSPDRPGGRHGPPHGRDARARPERLSNAAASGINITSGNLFLEGGNTGGIGTSMAPLYIDLAPGALLEEANAQFDVYIVEKNGSLSLVTAFSAAGNVNLTADGSILNGNTFNERQRGSREHQPARRPGWRHHQYDRHQQSRPLDIVLTGGSVVAQAYDDIYLDATHGDLVAGGIHSLHGDLFLSAPFGSILEPASEPVGTAVAIGNNITLSADPVLGFIGSPTQAFEINAIAPGTLTSSSGENAYITQPLGDLDLNTVTVSNGGTAFIVVPDGNIYQRQSRRPERAFGKDVLVRQPEYRHVGQPITTEVGNVQGQSTTGSTFLVNSGALSVGGVVPGNSMGMEAGGMIDVVAMSPITIIQNVLAVGMVNYTSTHDATGGNMEVAPGVSIVSTTSSVNFYAGDNFTAGCRQHEPGGPDRRGGGYQHQHLRRLWQRLRPGRCDHDRRRADRTDYQHL